MAWQLGVSMGVLWHGNKVTVRIYQIGNASMSTSTVICKNKKTMWKDYNAVGLVSFQPGCNLTTVGSETNAEASNKKNRRHIKGRSFKLA
jgi:hypothetical protein